MTVVLQITAVAEAKEQKTARFCIDAISAGGRTLLRT